MNIAVYTGSRARLGSRRLITTWRWKPCSPGAVPRNSSAIPPTARRSIRVYRPNGMGWEAPTFVAIVPQRRRSGGPADHIEARTLEGVRKRRVEAIELAQGHLLGVGEVAPAAHDLGPGA